MEPKPMIIKPASKIVEEKLKEQGVWMLFKKPVKDEKGYTSYDFYALKVGIN